MIPYISTGFSLCRPLRSQRRLVEAPIDHDVAGRVLDRGRRLGEGDNGATAEQPAQPVQSYRDKRL